MSLDNSLFIHEIILERNNVINFAKYPFNIPVIKNLDKINLKTPITFFSW